MNISPNLETQPLYKYPQIKHEKENKLNIGQYSKTHLKNHKIKHKCAAISKSFFKNTIIPSILISGALLLIALPELIPIIALALIIKFILDILKIKKINKFKSRIQPTKESEVNKKQESNESEIFITENGRESIESKLKIIESAKKEILISGSYCGGTVFDKSLELINKKLSENSNLKVRILSNNDLLTKSNRIKIKELAKKFPHQFFLIEVIKPMIILPSIRTISNHTKFVIVDGQIGVTGGTGLQDLLSQEEIHKNQKITIKEKILGQGARDSDIVIKGTIAQDMRKQYFYLLDKWEYLSKNNKKYGEVPNFNKELITGYLNQESTINHSLKEIFPQFKNKIFEHPDNHFSFEVGCYEHGQEHGCKLAYLKQISEAKENLTLAQMCINDPDIISELIKAAKRGVKITLITNGNHSKAPLSAKITAPVNRSTLIKFLPYKNVDCYEYRKPYVLYHKKVLITDEETEKATLIMGSYNTAFCALPEDEDILIAKSKNTARYAKKVINDDIKNSKLLDRNSYRGMEGKVKLLLNKTLKKTILFFTANIFQ